MRLRARRARAAASCAVVVGLVLVVVGGCGRAAEERDDAADADSPLDGYLNEIWGEYDPDAPDPQRLRAEELIAACMSEAGFEYQPVPTLSGTVVAQPETLGTVEFAREYGYGYSTEPWGEGGGNLTWPILSDESEAARLNREYVGSLSESAKVEYDEALLGQYAVPTQEILDAEVWDAAKAGCSGVGWGAVEDAADAGAQLGDLQRAMNSMRADIQLDPRIDEALASWAACMTTAGYPELRGFRDAENLVGAMVNDFVVAVGTRVAWGAPEGDLAAVEAAVPDELADLRAREIDVAVADATCRAEVGYDRIHRDVANEHEQAIVDTYREDLEAWVAAVQEARAEADQ